MQSSKKEKIPYNNTEYCKEWYGKNKEKHLAYMKEKKMCDCGAMVSRVNFSRHMNSRKHKAYENESKGAIKCKCGGSYHPDLKIAHIQNKQHQDYLKTIYN